MADTSLSGLLDTTFNEYGKNFLMFFKNLSFIYAIPYTITMLVFYLLSTVLGISSSFSSAALGQDVMMAILTVILMVVIIYLSLIFGAAQYRMLKMQEDKKNITPKTVFRDSQRYVGRLFGLGLLLMIIFVALIAVLALPMLLVLGLSLSVGPNILAGFLLGVIAIVFITWLSVRWLFASVVILFEDKRVIESLKASWQLTKGRWWSTFGKYFVISLIVGGIAMFISVGITMVSFVLAFIPIIGPTMQTAFQVLLSVMIAPISAIFITRWYQGLKQEIAKSK